MEDTATSNTMVPIRNIAQAPNTFPAPFMIMPLEIILSIAEYLDPTDLNSLIKTARQFASLLTSRLYDLAITHDWAGEQTPMMWAAGNGKALVIGKLLKRGADPSETVEGATLLHYAACSGYEATVQPLLDAGAGVSKQDYDGDTPLQLAARGGHQATVRLLLDAGAGNFSEPNEDGKTPLHYAASEGHEAIVRMLLDTGAAVSKQDYDSNTPLQLAACSGHEATIRLLLDAKVDIDSEAQLEIENALRQAATNGHVAAVQLLVDSGASISALGEDGRTALQNASCEGHADVVQLMLNSKANTGIDTQDENGITALHIAAYNGHADVVQLLLDFGASISILEVEGRSAFHHASSEGHADVVRLLLNHGADPGEEDKYVNTALHLAACEGNTRVIRLLLDSGANPGLFNESGDTPLHLAAQCGHQTAIERLLDFGVSISGLTQIEQTPLHLAASEGHKETVQFLLDSGSDLFAMDVKKHTALHYAAQGGHEAVFQQLLDAYVEKDMDFLGKCQCGKTVLDKAAEAGHGDIVKLLIEKGVDITPGNDGFTPLHAATVKGWTNLAMLLLRHGADPLCLDCYGRNPMDWAQLHQPTFDLMLSACDDYSPTDPALAHSTLRKSIVMFATRILNLEENDFYKLGKCLLYENDIQAACAAFAQEAEDSDEADEEGNLNPVPVCCDSCEEILTIADGRFVCRTCPGVDLCSSCIEKYNSEGLQVSVKDMSLSDSWNLTRSLVNRERSGSRVWLRRIAYPNKFSHTKFFRYLRKCLLGTTGLKHRRFLLGISINLDR